MVPISRGPIGAPWWWHLSPGEQDEVLICKADQSRAAQEMRSATVRINEIKAIAEGRCRHVTEHYHSSAGLIWADQVPDMLT